MAVDIDRLIEIEPGVGAPAEGVDDVVAILGAEAGEHGAAEIGPAIAIGIREMEQFGAVGDIRAAISRQHGRGHVQAVGEERAGFGNAIAVAVFQHRHRVVGHLPRPDLRIDA